MAYLEDILCHHRCHRNAVDFLADSPLTLHLTTSLLLLLSGNFDFAGSHVTSGDRELFRHNGAADDLHKDPPNR